MAERPQARRYAGAIVPDPEASLVAHRSRYPEPPRVWPLWLLILLLVAALTALGGFGWQERQRLTSETARLSGELSNVHARFAAAIGEGEGLDRLEARLDTLARQDKTHERRFAILEEDLAVGGEHLEGLIAQQETRLIRMGEAAASREAILSAFQESLDALERAGEEGRSALDERLAELRAQAIDTADFEALGAAQQASERRLAKTQEAQQSRLETLQERVDALADTLEGIDEAREDKQQQQDALRQRQAALEAEVAELRRSQLALSAQLEVLRP